MKNTYLLLLIVSLLYSCKNDTNTNQFFSPDNIPSQFFQIDILSDTIIQAQGGTILEISKNTFASNSGSVKLEVKEVLTKTDIIQSGLFTVTENNEILESDGMLYVDVEPKQELLKDIKVKMPTAALNPDMQLFELGDGNLWKNPQSLLESPESKRIALGQELYTKHCATCHNENLREDMTGPALGNVHLFRTEEWLRDFTLNSSKMIRSLDSLSICLWNNWKPIAMTSFEGVLSEREISDIYFFIGNESRLQKIEENEVEYIVECNVTYTGSPDDPESRDWRVSAIEAKTNQGNKFEHTHASEGASPTMKFTPYVPTFTDTLQNVFRINKFGWTNVDYFLRNAEILTEKVEMFKVKINVVDTTNTNLQVLVIFRKRNIVIPLSYWDESEEIYTVYGKKEIKMPKGETVYVLAIGKDGFFGVDKMYINNENYLELTMKQTSRKRILKYIRGL